MKIVLMLEKSQNQEHNWIKRIKDTRRQNVSDNLIIQCQNLEVHAAKQSEL